MPIGYNLRGKTVTITRKDLVPRWVEDGAVLETNLGIMFGLFLLESPEYFLFGSNNGSSDEANIILLYNAALNIETEYPLGWQNISSFTFADDQDYIVTENSLYSHEGNFWGFDYAYIID